jgi:glucose/arabinose dehydrogenase
MNSTLTRSIAYLALACLFLAAGLWLVAEYRPLLAGGPESPAAQADIQITVGEIVASGFTRPVQVTHAGDGSGRLFVVEQTGYIRIIQNGAVLSTPFLNVSDRVTCCGEQGLLGLAFHPNYQSNGDFYINYTRNGDGATIIARYRVSANPNVADPNSATTLLTISQPYANHNGGQVMFGPDGYLYIGMGDGGGGGDPDRNAQNKNTLLGAMLRIDVDGGTPYANPPDNPYVGTDGRDEIWAIGLRNPWRFSFDRATGDLYIGDVGQNAWEEISFQAAGTPGSVNFGWPCREGTHTYTTESPCNQPAFLAGLTNPIAEYSHSLGRSVTGGFVYRGALYPALVGRYFYADYVTGRIWSLVKTGSNPTTWSAPALELDTGLNVSAFGEDESGELYITGYADGTVRRLGDASGPIIYFPLILKNASADLLSTE